MNDNVAIRVENVSKTFRLPHEKQTSIKGAVLNFYKRKKSYEKQHVLQNVSFEIKKGEFFGIVGRNGGGKSTLLKLISGIYEPDVGNINVSGKLTPFIELGVGFNPELTGRENVFLNGALLGFSRSEMEEMYDDIVVFAELGKFMDQKLKNYSSGMQVRLAFSIAIRAESEILVMDEVLAVGDAAFQKKCFDIFRDLKNQGRTIVLVTHDMANVERFCDRALILNEGKVLAITTPQDASATYSRLNIEGTNSGSEGVPMKAKQKTNRWGSGGIKIKKVSLFSHDRETDVFEIGKPFRIEVSIERDKHHIKTPIVCGMAFYNQDGVNISGPNSAKYDISPDTTKLTAEISSIKLAAGEYKLTIAIFNKEITEPYDFIDRQTIFSVVSDHQVHGLVELDVDWHG